MALNRAPGILRHFAFERWRNFRQDLWEEELAQARRGERPEEVPAIVALDRSPEAVEGTIANAKAAEVEGWVKVEVGDAAAPPQLPGGPGWICTNPPYGHRLGGGKALPSPRGPGQRVRDCKPRTAIGRRPSAVGG